jgi:hypothetical protein
VCQKWTTKEDWETHVNSHAFLPACYLQ